VVANPEFEREGSAVRDFLEPSLIVVGGEDMAHVRRVADVYAPLGVTPSLVSLRAAEMIKYACNAFHAVKIDFANEIGTLCSAVGADGHEVMDAFCRDTRLNISAAYLKPGFAFGGSCLPKDLRALVHRARRLNLAVPLMESVLWSNDRHLTRAVDAVLDLPAQRIGIFGLAFKPDTDDVRESPVVALLEQLIGKGRSVRVFDPHIQMEGLHGSNQRFLLAAIPHISGLLDSSLEHTLRWAEHVVVTQTPSAHSADRIRQSGVPVLDLSRGELPNIGPEYALQ
jgi:GDP-mannose 6-dehydrogenase